MADFPSAPDLLRIARDEVLLKNSQLTRDIVERAGSDANALTAASVAVGDAVVGQLIRVTAALSIDNAKGADLDRLLFDRFQLTRKDASPALGSVVLSASVAVVGSFLIPVGTVFQTTDNKQFASTAERTFLSGQTSSPSVPVASVLAGLGQQVRPASIRAIVSSIAGAPAGLTVTNALASSGADDAELDDDFRARGKLFYQTARRGTLLAIQAGALAVPGVRRATVFEEVDPDGSAARVVELVVADAFTEQLVLAAVLPVAYAAQSAELTAAVQAGLSDVRAAGIQVVVTTASVVLLGVTLGLRFRPSVDVEATSQAARAATVSYVNSLAPGASFVVADLVEVLRGVPGLQVLGGEVLAPTLDQSTLPASVYRTSLGLVTVTTQGA